MDSIFHVTTPTEWDAAQNAGIYRHPSLDTEGFIHLSDRNEIVATTERHYPGRTGLILLEVDPAVLGDLVVWELAPAVGREFPHCYGPIPLEAVVGIHPWDVDETGTRVAPSR